MQKFLRTLTLVALLCVPWVVQGQTVVTIGDTTSTVTNYTLPVNMFYHYSLTQQIYTASEIGTAGMITAISFDYAYTSSFSMSDVQVYMKSVARNSFTTTTDMEPVSASDLVWTGTLSASASGWITITLDVPFVYDGSSNLLVCFYDPTSGYPGNSYKFRTTATTGSDYYSIAYYSDSDVPSLTNITTYNGNKSRYQYRDNIKLTLVPLTGYCPRPANFAARNITTSSATLGWSIPSAFDNVSSVSVEYGPAGFVPSSGTAATVDGDSAVLSNLTPGTAYQAMAISDCSTDGNSDTSWVSFRTKPLPVDNLPYFTGFEPTDDQNWEFLNQTNGWVIDTAVRDSGNYSMYISNNGGAANAYSHTVSFSYAYREFTFTDAGDYQLSFDWKANGEGNYDYIRVFAVPADMEITPSLIGTTATPTGWKPLDGGNKLNLKTTWQHHDGVFFAEENSTYKIVFYWRNDGSGGTQPPAAIDNVSLAAMPCSRPQDFHVDDVTTNSITLAWTAIGDASTWLMKKNNDSLWTEVSENPYTISDLDEATFYNFTLRSLCGTDTTLPVYLTTVTACQPVMELPYVQTFDSLATGAAANFDPCWVKGTNISVNYPYVNTTNSNKALYAVVSTDTAYAYAILPELDNSIDVTDMELSFLIKASSTSYNGRVIVAMLPDRTFNSATEYDTVGIVNVGGNTTYQLMSVPFINYTGSNRNVALLFTVDGSTTGVYLDTLNLHTAPACIVPYNLTVTEADTTSISISFDGRSGESFLVKIVSDSNYADSSVVSSFEHTFTGLTPYTKYTISVRQVCTDGYSEAATVTAKTPMPGVALPYSTGFETADDNNWYLDNGTATNKWCIGSAVNNGGSRSLYVSNDNGTTNAYSNSSAYIYAFKAVECPEAGQYAVSFDWKARGESGNYDFLRVFAMPATSSYVSGTSSGISGTSLPNGWQALDGGQKLNWVTTWQTTTNTFNVTTPGVYYIVFYWYNDASGGEQPPAAVDNVQIMRNTCPQPRNLVLDSIHATEAYVHWRRGASEETWLVRANGGEWATATDTTYHFTDLAGSTDYRFEVAAYCGADDTSFIIGVNGHTTNLCNPVTGLAVSNVTAEGARVKWANVANVSWGYEYGPVGFEEGEGISGTATVDSVNLTELTDATEYEFRVWSICPEGNGPIATVTFTTRGLPVSTFPYSTGFESGEDIAWDMVFGSTNKWVVGSAAHSSGSRSLYISNDNGATNGYVAGPTMGYAYRTFNVSDAGQYLISFDWRANGESNYDFLRAWLTPATATFTANQLPDGTTSASSYTATTPAGWIDLGGKMNLQTNWQVNENFIDLEAGQYNLVFLWTSDVSGVYTPAAAIDNVVFAPVTCARPVALVVDSIDSDAAHFHWTPAGETMTFEVVVDTNAPVTVSGDTTFLVSNLQPLSNHTIAVRTVCGTDDVSAWLRGNFRTTCGPVATLPYYEDFESYGSGSSSAIDSCWTKGTNYTTAYPYPYSTNAVSGTRSLYFYATSSYYSYAALPAFTTPVNQLMMSFKVRRYAGNTTRLLVGVMSDPNDISTFETVSTVDLTSATSGSIHDIDVYFNGYTGTGRYIAIYDAPWTTSSYAYVDSVTVSLAPACVRPMDVTLAAVDGTSATVDVVAAPGASLVYVLRQGTTVVDSTVVANNSRTFTGLTPHTQYTLSVRTLCSDGLTEASTLSFKTTYLGVDLPYSTGFEGTAAAEWNFENGTATNKWFVGTAANNGGSQALYISGDNGASNSYNNGSSSRAFAFKSFNVTPGQYGVSFDWRATGEVGYDYLRAFLVPGTVDITADISTISTANVPSGWIALDGSHQLNNVTGWQNSVAVFNVPTAGVYNLLFYWYNDYSVGTNPPAAVDNVVFKAITCPAPTNFVVDTTTSTGAQFHWTRGGQETSWMVAVGDNAPVAVTDTFYTVSGLSIATDYQVRIAAVCSEDDESFNLIGYFTTECGAFPVPFVEEFETRGSMDDLYCWNYSNTTVSGSTYPRLTYLTGNLNDRLLMACGGAYFILPEVAADLSTLELGMSYQTGGDSNYILLGYLDSIDQPVTDTVFVDTLWAYNYPVSGLGHRVYRLLNDAPATAKHVVIKTAVYTTSSYSYDFFGYVQLAAPRTCFAPETIELTASTPTSATLSWSVTEGTTPSGYQVEYGPRRFVQGTGTMLTTPTASISINGLSNTIPYEVYVRSICGAGDTSEWSLAYEFFTECAPLNLPVLYSFDEYTRVGNSYGEYLPNCWAFDSTTVDSATAANYYTPCMYNNNSNIQLYASAANAVVALPEINASLDTVMMSFDMTLSSTNYALVVGMVASQDSGFAATFEPIDTLRYADNGHVEVFFASYAGTNSHIAFKNISLSGTSYAYVYIDSLRIQRAPTCYPVRHLTVADYGENSITIDWDDIVAASSWAIEYGAEGFTRGQGTVQTVTAHPATITGLTAATAYDFYVTPVCSASDHGTTAGPLTQSTTCAPVALPYLENFDSYTSLTSPAATGILPDCWNHIKTNSYTSTDYLPQVYYSSTYAASGRYSLRLYGNGYTMLPPMPVDLDTLALTFSHYKTAAYYDLEVGVMEGNTFVPIQTINTPSITHRDVTVYFNNYTGSSRIIAFRNSYGTSSYSYHYIDSVRVDYLPACPQVANVHAVGASATSVTVDWSTINNNATAWQVEIGAAGHSLGAATATRSIVTTHPVTLRNLDTATAYDVYVRPICSASDTGAWSDVAQVATSICDGARIASTGTATGTSYMAPVNNYYHYTLSETIIDSAELASMGTTPIEMIAYSYNYSTAMTDKTDVTIWLQPTNKTTFSSGTDLILLDSSAVQVYTGSLNCSRGWNYFNLSTPYQWDGHSNLVVIVDDNSDDYNGISYVFNTSACSGYKTLYYYSDSYNPTPTSATYSGTTGRVQWRPTMQLLACGQTCDEPLSINATATDNEVILSWSGNGSAYEVAIAEGANWVVPEAGGEIVENDTTYTFNGLEPETRYTVGVRTVCADDLTSTWVTYAITTDEHPCAVPTNLAASNVTLNSATLGWTDGEEGQSAWQIAISGTGMNDTINVTTNPYTVTGLAHGVTYTFTVRAVCTETNRSAWSAPATFPTLACEAPTNVTVGSITSNSAVVSWTAPAGATRFIVNYGMRDFSQGNGSFDTVENATRCTLSGLEANMNYDVYVMNVCGEGVQSNWAKAQFTTERTGIDDVASAAISLYPNPASSTVTLKGIEGKATVTVVDMNGRKAGEWTVSDGSLTIDVTEMAQGAYFVRIVGEQVNAIRKLIVR